MASIGKTLLLVGAVCVGVGALLLVFDKLGLGRWFGQLPGDITWKGKSTTVHFPLATSLIVSLVLTILLNWWLRRSQ